MKLSSPPFSAASLDQHPPWTILSTRALASTLGTDPIALAMRRYRSIGPKSVPDDWLKGRVTGYLVSDVLAWLGDSRPETTIFRDALGFVTDEPDPVIRLYARAKAQNGQPLIGAKFSSTGRTKYYNYLIDLS
jgi:hypothetical protein